MHEHLVLCGGVRPGSTGAENVLRLQTSGADANIKPRFHDLSRHFVKDVPDLLSDLLEIASYVYAADGSITRGGDRLKGMGKDWRRKLDFVIPVRRLDVWQRQDVATALAGVLGFLSDDDYSFEFANYPNPTEFASYLDLDGGTKALFAPDKVILFSGGLDSLAGAVDEVIGNGKSALLVSHHSSSKTFNRQKHLIAELQEKSPGRVMHLPVLVQNAKSRVSEFTLRSRSFLFASLAAIAAKMNGVDRIHFFENGIVSLNLPIAPQVVGGRATRTTHPRTLAGFSNLFSLLFDEEFFVDNPFFWKTKAEVSTVMARHNCEDLIRGSVSCSHVRDMTTYKSHCGVCSQCIDRRFGTLGAGLGDFDPEESYAVRLLEDPRVTREERDLASLYTKSALETSTMSDEAFYGKFAGQISQALRFLPGRQDDAAKGIVDLYHRHAMGVRSVLNDGIKDRSDDFLTKKLPVNCLLRMVTNDDWTLALPLPRGPVSKEFEIGQDSGLERPLPKEIRLAIDEEAGEIRFEGLPPLSGKMTYGLVRSLAEKRREDIKTGKAPENYGSLLAADIADRIGSNEEEAVRKAISRIRKRFSKNHSDRYGKPCSENELIETVHWHGYRLSPKVLVLSLDQVGGA